DVAGVLLVDSAGAKVEHRVLVQLPDRRGVTALHVVRQDLQSWRTVDERFPRKEEVLVHLPGDRLLGVLPDVDVPVDHAARLPSQDAALRLEALAGWGGRGDPRAV